MPRILVLLALSQLPAWSAAPVREQRDFDAGWRFYRGDAAGAERVTFDDTRWRKVNLPHDWSIEGPYSATNASGTGYLPGGIGWYRKTFALDESLTGDKIELVFDVDPADVNRLVQKAISDYDVRADNSRVVVNVSGNTVTLIGHVPTQAQRDAVVGAAWLGHGVMAVFDEIEITG